MVLSVSVRSKIVCLGFAVLPSDDLHPELLRKNSQCVQSTWGKDKAIIYNCLEASIFS